jgi:membrane fusion protein (multidrug efflux system)
MGDSTRTAWSRRPLALARGALLLAPIAGGGYLYWDNASHFETTDDAFIAARQFAIAPKISGYINEVPVTDNQHVETCQVIARIDDRDYRTSLARLRPSASTMTTIPWLGSVIAPGTSKPRCR